MLKLSACSCEECIFLQIQPKTVKAWHSSAKQTKSSQLRPGTNKQSEENEDAVVLVVTHGLLKKCERF